MSKKKEKLWPSQDSAILSFSLLYRYCLISLKDKYPNFEVGLKCILMVNPYSLVCSYIK